MNGKKQGKPVILISRCLAGRGCRWDGSRIHFKFGAKLKKVATLVEVCPEMEIGLGVPRAPIRVVRKRGKELLCQPETGRDLTKAMKEYSRSAVKKMPRIDGIILKGKSPSCGPGDAKVFIDLESEEPVGKTAGFFAREVMKRFPGAPLETEANLEKPGAFKDFLSRISRIR